MKSVFMGKSVAQWLMKNIEHVVTGISSKQFFIIRYGDVAYTLQQSANSFGHFLLLTEFKDGGSRRSILISRGRAKIGLRTFGLELRKMLDSNQYAVDYLVHSKFVA